MGNAKSDLLAVSLEEELGGAIRAHNWDRVQEVLAMTQQGSNIISFTFHPAFHLLMELVNMNLLNMQMAFMAFKRSEMELMTAIRCPKHFRTAYAQSNGTIMWGVYFSKEDIPFGVPYSEVPKQNFHEFIGGLLNEISTRYLFSNTSKFLVSQKVDQAKQNLTFSLDIVSSFDEWSAAIAVPVPVTDDAPAVSDGGYANISDGGYANAAVPPPGYAEATSVVYPPVAASGAVISPPYSPSAPVYPVDPPAESKEIPDEKLCCICMDREKTHAFTPCHHKAVCEPCSNVIIDRHDPCPICRNVVSTAVRIYG